MAIFPALGLAVLGIFITIVLSGVLAGIIAYGLVDSRYREVLQARVIATLIDIPFHSFDLLSKSKEIQQLRSEGPRPWWGEITLEVMRDRPHFRLTELIQLRPANFFRLPHRQLCAQIANALAAETRHKEDGNENGHRRIYALTMLLLVADNVARGRDYPLAIYIPFAAAKSRALAFIDSIQVELAEVVQRRATFVASFVIFITLMAILAPNIDALNLFEPGSPFLLRGIGGLIALILAPILLLLLSLAANIVATLTFRWIDQFASAR